MNPKSFPSRRSNVLARHGHGRHQPAAGRHGRPAHADGRRQRRRRRRRPPPPCSTSSSPCPPASAATVSPWSTRRQRGQVTALNGSGRAPAAFTLAEAQRLGLDEIPLHRSAAGDGARHGQRLGGAAGSALARMTLAECLAPAIDDRGGGLSGQRADQRRLAALRRKAVPGRRGGPRLPARAPAGRDPPPARPGPHLPHRRRGRRRGLLPRPAGGARSRPASRPRAAT